MRCISLVLAGLACAVLAPAAMAHCQVPCGIYGDQRQFDRLEEDIKTIAKGMGMITELSKDSAKNMNQIVRWVNNKDHHAQAIQETCLNYFLAQRIKVPKDMKDAGAMKTYHTRLALVHQMIVAAMKCKQTTDPANAKKLTELLTAFKVSYFSKADIEHLEQHKRHQKIKKALRKKHKG